MKIHHVIETTQDRWEVDPVRGPGRVRSAIVRPSDVHRLVFKKKTYDIGPDGSFDVPNEVGKFYVGKLGWYEGVLPVAVNADPSRSR